MSRRNTLVLENWNEADETTDIQDGRVTRRDLGSMETWGSMHEIGRAFDCDRQSTFLFSFR